MLAEPRVCLRCGSSDTIPYDDPALSVEGPRHERQKFTSGGVSIYVDPPDIRWRDLELKTLRRYLCPQCGTNSVTFADGGITFD